MLQWFLWPGFTLGTVYVTRDGGPIVPKVCLQQLMQFLQFAMPTFTSFYLRHTYMLCRHVFLHSVCILHAAFIVWVGRLYKARLTWLLTGLMHGFNMLTSFWRPSSSHIWTYFSQLQPLQASLLFKTIAFRCLSCIANIPCVYCKDSMCVLCIFCVYFIYIYMYYVYILLNGGQCLWMMSSNGNELRVLGCPCALAHEDIPINQIVGLVNCLGLAPCCDVFWIG